MKLLRTVVLCLVAAVSHAEIPNQIPEGYIDIPVRPCNENGPMDKTAPEVQTIATVSRVAVQKCQWVGRTCGLVRGETNGIFIEYSLTNAAKKFEGKRIRRFPKKIVPKEKSGFSATIDVCGYLQGMGNICAAFSLPNVDACTQGLTCTKKGSRIPKARAKHSEKHLINVQLPVNSAYPTVKVISKWEVTDQTNRKAPKLFCVYIPLAVV